MIKIEVKKDGVKVGCNVNITGRVGDVKLEMCTLLEALESDEKSRDLLNYAIDYRINSLIKEYKELEDDGEL